MTRAIGSRSSRSARSSHDQVSRKDGSSRRQRRRAREVGAGVADHLAAFARVEAARQVGRAGESRRVAEPSSVVTPKDRESSRRTPRIGSSSGKGSVWTSSKSPPTARCCGASDTVRDALRTRIRGTGRPSSRPPGRPSSRSPARPVASPRSRPRPSSPSPSTATANGARGRSPRRGGRASRDRSAFCSMIARNGRTTIARRSPIARRAQGRRPSRRASCPSPSARPG